MYYKYHSATNKDFMKIVDKKQILILGDSHAREYFGSTNLKGKLKPKDLRMNHVQADYHFDVHCVSGATAQGAVNPSSKTQALSIFKKTLSIINPDNYSHIAIMLGEVDCGFVIWYRSEKYSIPVEDQLKLTTKNLFDFLDQEVVPLFSPNKIILIGSVLPTIKDNQNWGEIAHLRGSIKATQLERTNLTLRYNDILKQKSSTLGSNYIDITRDTLNKNTHLIDDNYLNSNKNDHHLSFEKTWKFWIKNLNKTLQ